MNLLFLFMELLLESKKCLTILGCARQGFLTHNVDTAF
jgi:hypothetical protein